MFEVRYKSNRVKYKQYYIFEEDIESGEYYNKFIEVFETYKPLEQYNVEEFSFGYIIQLPLSTSVDVPVLQIDKPKSKIKISEVLEYAKSNNLYS